jgi:hypothetical protein
MSPLKRMFPIAVVLCALALLLSPREAKACGSGSGGGDGYAVVAGLAVAGLGLFATDVTFSVIDVVKAGQGKHVSQGLATAEVIIGTPQMVLVTAYLASPSTEKSTAVYAIAALPAFVFLHGLITLITVDYDAEALPPPDGSMLVHPYAPAGTQKVEDTPRVHAPEERLRVSVAPTMLPGGTPDKPTLIPALGAWGSF